MLEPTALNLLNNTRTTQTGFCKHAKNRNIHKAAQSPPMAHEPDSQEPLACHAPKQQAPYLFAGELRPPLPKEEVDRVVAMESLLASSTGRVLGRRSGRPRWEPELKHRLFHHQHKWDRVTRAPTLATGRDPCWIPPKTDLRHPRTEEPALQTVPCSKSKSPHDRPAQLLPWHKCHGHELLGRDQAHGTATQPQRVSLGERGPRWMLGQG